MRKGIVTASVAAVALGLGAGSTYLWIRWQDHTPAPLPAVTPAVSPPLLPSTTAVTLSLDGTPVQELLPTGFQGCGAPWQPEASAQHGIAITVALEDDGPGAALAAQVAFTNAGQERRTLLTRPFDLVLVRDGIVVGALAVGDIPLTPVDLEPGQSSSPGPGTLLDGAMLCETQEALAALWAGFDFDSATVSEREQFQAHVDRLHEEAASLPSGEYALYAWSPVMLGPQAAAARYWLDEGYEDLAALTTVQPSNPLLSEPPLSRYCSMPHPDDPFAAAAFVCATIPEELWAQVLTREVPADGIVDVEPFVVVSEPVTLQVP